MAIRNEDKEWISTQISTAIDSLRPHGWRKLIFWLRELGPLAATVAIFVAMLGITFGAIYQSFAHVKDETQFRTHTTDTLDRTTDRLGRIEETLTVLQAQLAAIKYANAKPEELKKYVDDLKGIKNTLANARKDTPNFWPTSFQVITLLSQAISNPAIQKESILDNVRSDILGGIEVSNQQVLLKNLVVGVIFRNSIIRFDPSVRLANDVFYDCVFIFPAEQNPPKPLQEIGNTLLAASDLSRVTINAS